jgi:branched-subunit amino acid ABC-type transport system permease component
LRHDARQSFTQALSGVDLIVGPRGSASELMLYSVFQLGRPSRNMAHEAYVALRALPVIILGGLTSVPGAIIGGLIIGVGEKLSEVYLGPFVGGGIEIWFAYMLALVFLLFRPQGLFGEKIIDRV